MEDRVSVLQAFVAGEEERFPSRRGEGSLWRRLYSGRFALLLSRNTIVSIFVFGIGLLVLWQLVERFGAPKIPAAAFSFLVSNSIHYTLARVWIFRGTRRSLGPGFAYFLINAVIGMIVTVGLFAAFMAFGLHYLWARVVASLFAGLLLFLLNALFNFKSL